MTTEPTSLDDKLTELVTALQGQRATLGDFAIRTSLATAIRLSRMKAKDKKEHDRITSEHELFQEFCKEIGLKTKAIKGK